MAETLQRQHILAEGAASRIAWLTPAAVVGGTGLVALCAHISIPLGFTPVPLTMQNFGVLLIGLLLSPRAAFASMALYVIEGMAGLPVFSPHPGGVTFLHLFGPSGGYLVSYPFAAALASSVYRYARRGFIASLMASSLATVLIWVVGATWLEVVSRVPLSVLLAQSVAPFLAGDILKAVAAASCARVFESWRKASRA